VQRTAPGKLERRRWSGCSSDARGATVTKDGERGQAWLAPTEARRLSRQPKAQLEGLKPAARDAIVQLLYQGIRPEVSRLERRRVVHLILPWLVLAESLLEAVWRNKPES
jgi:hypothetical protein